MSSAFYANLTPLTQFAAITEPGGYRPLPDDWSLVLTDVRGSTRAIAEGRYKEVNLIGAASIVALLNVAGPVDIPFVFGGDGATLAIPAELREQARVALAALQALSRDVYDLELRAGIVPAGDLAAAGSPVRVARLAISPQYVQAVFSGGLMYAERLLKDELAGAPYRVPPAPDAADADLSGLECRWQDIPSRHGETVSLLVTPAPGAPDAVGTTLRAVIAEIDAVYGGDSERNPIALELLRTSFDPRRLTLEARARAAPGRAAQVVYVARTLGLNLAVGAYRRYERMLGRTPWWDRYRELVFRTADFKKYDDTLRMVLAGTAAQRERLEAYLESRYRRDELAYGVHVADRALMTCLVFERMGRQVHFVDGADGGYALAAKAMKARLGALPAAA